MNPSRAAGGQGGGETPLVVACPHCGKKNRVLARRQGEATCGACKRPLAAAAAGAAPPPGKPLVVTDASWASEVERSPLPVLVDFWAPWCGPCRAIAPTVEALAAERAGRLKVVKVNVDENPEISRRFAIQAIPTLMVFRDGQIIDQIRGLLPRPALETRLTRLGL